MAGSAAYGLTHVFLKRWHDLGCRRLTCCSRFVWREIGVLVPARWAPLLAGCDPRSTLVRCSSMSAPNQSRPETADSSVGWSATSPTGLSVGTSARLILAHTADPARRG